MSIFKLLFICFFITSCGKNQNFEENPNFDGDMKNGEIKKELNFNE